MRNAVNLGLLVLALFLFTHTIIAAGLVLYGWAGRKGYRGPRAALIMTVSAALAVALTVAIAPSETLSDQVMTSCVVAILWGMIAALITALLPRRNPRAHGVRAIGFPFRLSGWLLAAAGCLLGGTAVVLWLTGQRNFALAVNGAAMAAICVGLGRYLATRAGAPVEPSIADLLKKDRRAPVLYLRSFETERQPFAIGDGLQYARYAKDFQQFGGLGQTVGIPFEQYMADVVSEHLGPFVALGSPEDYLIPHGAVRDYATDANWKDAFGELAREASCILAEFTVSGNLGWELEYLRHHGLQRKLCVVTPPPDQSVGLGGFYVRWMARLRGLTRPVSWDGFRTHLRAAGYEIDFDDPGPGVALSFNQDGKALILTVEAVKPREFIEPIAAWIVDDARIGRSEPVACAKCSRTCYIPAAYVSISSPLCRRCRSPHPGLRKGIATVLAIGTGLTVAMILAAPQDFLPDDSWIREHNWLASAALALTSLVVVLLIVPDERPTLPAISYEPRRTPKASQPVRAAGRSPSVRSTSKKPRAAHRAGTGIERPIEGKWVSVDSGTLQFDMGAFIWTQPKRTVAGRYIESFDKTGLVFKNGTERTESRVKRRRDTLTITLPSHTLNCWVGTPGTYLFKRVEDGIALGSKPANCAGTDIGGDLRPSRSLKE